MPQSKVYCPCGKKCSGYSGASRKCQRVETSKVIPQRFISHMSVQASREAGSGWGGLLMGGLVLGGSLLASNSDATSYEVWECPACHCEVLLQITKQEGGRRTQQMGDISSC